MTNRLKGLFFCLIALSAIFLFLPRIVFAQVVINEFLPNPSNGPDWIELYNSSDEDIDLGGWILDDEGTVTNMVDIKEATISARGFLVFEVGSRLNKSEDTIYLTNGEGSTVDEYSYSEDPGTDVSYGRMPDGGDWGICEQLTNGSSNQCILPAPEPEETSEPEPEDTPTPTPTPTPETPTPTPTKKPTPKPTPTLIPTPTGEILGEEATPAAEEATPTPTVLGEKTSNPVKFIPFVFIGLGSLLLLTSGGFILSPKLKMKYNHLRKSGEGEKII